MRVQWIKISNYRQFVDEEAILEFDKKLTVVAGANNSGKTSIMELIRNVLGSEKVVFKPEDIPVKNIIEWMQKVQIIFEDVLKEGSTTEKNFFVKICEKFKISGEEGKEEFDKEKCLPELKIKICVSYDPSCDDIQKYAECLMDLDNDKNQFFFLCALQLSENAFETELKKNYQKLKRRYDSLVKARERNSDGKKDRESSFQNMILDTYFGGLKANCYYCDENFEIFEKLEWDRFKKLFNIYFISASRLLDDESKDKRYTLSKEMVDLLEKSADSWNAIMKNLPDEIITLIEKTPVKETVRLEALDGLHSAIEEIVCTNGGHAATPGLQIDMKETEVKTLLSNTIAAKYEVQQYSLNEASQGLGLNNLVFMHLQLEKFKKEYDPQKANLYLIEEPEAHMHPQMQQVFTKYLLELKLENSIDIQGMITTHSTEIVGNVDFSMLRVVRQQQELVSKIIDLSRLDTQDGFYDWFFEVGYSDIIFADKAILYEGDTERFYLRKLLQSEENRNLRQQYISYVQVGGAYAFRYKELLDLLEIKTLIITDIDYAKDAIQEQDIRECTTTNATLKFFYNRSKGKNNPSVQELYEWKAHRENTVGHIYLAYQTEEDGFTRTLEEAMLCKLETMDASKKKTKHAWEVLKKNTGLKFALPNKISVSGKDANGKNVDINVGITDDTEISVRDILRATSGMKTDFMYSVIMNRYAECMQPEYIRKGLAWLREN